MTDNIKIELLDLCRKELQITWQENDTDERLLNYIINGAAKLERVAGTTDNDILAGGKANALFLAYVRRAMSGDTSTFEADYLSEIIALQTDYEVDNYDEE